VENEWRKKSKEYPLPRTFKNDQTCLKLKLNARQALTHTHTHTHINKVTKTL